MSLRCLGHHTHDALPLFHRLRHLDVTPDTISLPPQPDVMQTELDVTTPCRGKDPPAGSRHPVTQPRVTFPPAGISGRGSEKFSLGGCLRPHYAAKVAAEGRESPVFFKDQAASAVPYPISSRILRNPISGTITSAASVSSAIPVHKQVFLYILPAYSGSYKDVSLAKVIRYNSPSARETKDRRPDIPQGPATRTPPKHMEAKISACIGTAKVLAGSNVRRFTRIPTQAFGTIYSYTPKPLRSHQLSRQDDVQPCREGPAEEVATVRNDEEEEDEFVDVEGSDSDQPLSPVKPPPADEEGWTTPKKKEKKKKNSTSKTPGAATLTLKSSSTTSCKKCQHFQLLDEIRVACIEINSATCISSMLIILYQYILALLYLILDMSTYHALVSHYC
ncbi:hypothetical protein E2C01_038430 [Portunus trituberculatus]|uniref:Uncharacterized protein n=1 Tax=Portunus trituberculatus TaxID=210409 RepID=A0A5B7FHX5_PORTR|nr:hypothetical protein [Portunus trituberculatus]